MNRMMRFFLCAAALTALISMFFLGMRYLGAGKKLRETNDALEQSRGVWQSVAEEKEALQDQVAQLQSDLKEATLSLDESREKIITLTEDVEQLNKEIADLNDKLGKPD